MSNRLHHDKIHSYSRVAAETLLDGQTFAVELVSVCGESGQIKVATSGLEYFGKYCYSGQKMALLSLIFIF